MKLYLYKKVEIRLTEKQCNDFGFEYIKESPKTMKGTIVKYYYNSKLKRIIYDVQLEDSTCVITVTEDQFVDNNSYIGGNW